MRCGITCTWRTPPATCSCASSKGVSQRMGERVMRILAGWQDEHLQVEQTINSAPAGCRGPCAMHACRLHTQCMLRACDPRAPRQTVASHAPQRVAAFWHARQRAARDSTAPCIQIARLTTATAGAFFLRIRTEHLTARLAALILAHNSDGAVRCRGPYSSVVDFYSSARLRQSERSRIRSAGLRCEPTQPFACTDLCSASRSEVLQR